jgi:hypothetical protein
MVFGTVKLLPPYEVVRCDARVSGCHGEADRLGRGLLQDRGKVFRCSAQLFEFGVIAFQIDNTNLEESHQIFATHPWLPSHFRFATNRILTPQIAHLRGSQVGLRRRRAECLDGCSTIDSSHRGP